VNTEVTTAAKMPMKLSDDLNVLRPEITKVLPTHVNPDKFMRVVMTALTMNPALKNADRRSLLTAAVRAATDGLLPDGREGAFVTFYDKRAKANKVQWMPMVGGVLKKLRNSGKLVSITCNVIYQADAFRHWIDDVGEHLTHEPSTLALDRGALLGVYALAKTRDGGTYIEVMSRMQVEQVRAVSRAANDGPWVSWYDEMARKSVIRRLSKRLPMSTDVEEMFERDNENYDLASPQQVQEVSGGNEGVRQLLGIDSAEPEDEPEDEQPIASEPQT